MRSFVCQIAFDDAEPAPVRVQRVLDTIRGLDQPELVVLPELWLHGESNFSGWGDGIEIDDPVLRILAAEAAACRCHLHIGSVVLRNMHGRPTNTSLLFGPDGRFVARYDKLHLFGFDEGEAVAFAPGESTVTVPVAETRLGLAICFDLRFPELFRRLTDEGSEVIVIPAAWATKRPEHWRVLLRARAIESQSYVLAANTAGTHAGLTLAGNSAIIGPSGEVLAEADTSHDAVLFADLDLRALRDLRRSFPVLEWQRLRTKSEMAR